jgi:RimJ/RimL family protein N-acetyltransferase
MIGIETDRLIIRNFTVNDWQDLYELAMDYEQSELAKYDYGPWPSNLDEYKKIVEGFSQVDDFVAVALKEEEKLIGFISIGKKEEGDEHNFGFVFNSGFHGKGYATESCRAVLSYMFKELKVKKISTGTAKINKASNALLQRLGFKILGENKNSFRKDEEGNPIEFVSIDYILEGSSFSDRSLV